MTKFIMVAAWCRDRYRNWDEWRKSTKRAELAYWLFDRRKDWDQFNT